MWVNLGGVGGVWGGGGAGVDRSSKWCGICGVHCALGQNAGLLAHCCCCCCLLLLQLRSRHTGHEHDSAAAQNLLMLLSTARHSTARRGLGACSSMVAVWRSAQRSMAGCFRGCASEVSLTHIHTGVVWGAAALAEHGIAWRVCWVSGLSGRRPVPLGGKGALHVGSLQSGFMAWDACVCGGGACAAGRAVFWAPVGALCSQLYTIVVGFFLW